MAFVAFNSFQRISGIRKTSSTAVVVETPLRCRYKMTSDNLSSGYIKEQVSGVYDLQLFGSAAIGTLNGNICLLVSNTSNSAAVNNSIVGSTSTTCLSSATKMTIIWWFCQTDTAHYSVIWNWRLNNGGAAGNWENISYYGTSNTVAAFGSKNLSCVAVTNTWYFNAVVFDSATNVADRYVNPTTTSSAPTVSTNFNYQITNPRNILNFGGSDCYGNPGFSGGIADFRIYNTTLTNSQIYTIYTNGMNN
jgi:hypothetical protein